MKNDTKEIRHNELYAASYALIHDECSIIGYGTLYIGDDDIQMIQPRYKIGIFTEYIGHGIVITYRVHLTRSIDPIHMLILYWLRDMNKIKLYENVQIPTSYKPKISFWKRVKKIFGKE